VGASPGLDLALEERLIKFILPDLQHTAATTLTHYAQRVECFREGTPEHDPPGCPRPGLALSRYLYMITVFESSAMPSRIICPRCHSSVDPWEMDLASSPETDFLICRECDEPILLPTPCPALLPEMAGLADSARPACDAPVADCDP
jgi:hypothetical protein